MALRRLPWLVVLCLAAACTSGGSGTSATAPGATASPTFPVEPVNRLVVVDDAGNIVTIDPDGSNPQQVTDDAGPGTTYFQPIWSPVSSGLAWGEIKSGSSGVGLGDDLDGETTTVSMSALPFYVSWSPDGSRLGALHDSSGGDLDFEVVDIAGGTSMVAGSGAPFYFSWSPDASRVVAHVGAGALGTIDAAGEGEDQGLGSTGPGYQTPYWTPAGIFHVDGTSLVLRHPNGESEELATMSGPASFVVNRQGTMVAIETFADSDSGATVAFRDASAVPGGSVVVLDVESGEVEKVIDNLGVGFFWSPDGQSLLLLTPGSGLGEVDVSVWMDGETRPLIALTPPPSLVRDVLQFFDQYAQSLQVWSPDSTAVALPGARRGGQGIWTIPVDGSDPSLVHAGSWVAWSNG